MTRNVRDRIVCFRVTAKEYATISKISRKFKQSVSATIRQILLDYENIVKELERCRSELSKCKRQCLEIQLMYQEYSQLEPIEKIYTLKQLLREVKIRVRAAKIIMNVLEVLSQELTAREFYKILTILAGKGLIEIEEMQK